MNNHLVFYDGQCGLCDHLVQFLIRYDRSKFFLFAPLQGTTAQRIFKDDRSLLTEMDTLVLVENYGITTQRIFLFGQGAFRIFWLLGGFWKIIGWISFLPGSIYNWGYRLVARNRKYLFSNDDCIVPNDTNQDRFLP